MMLVSDLNDAEDIVSKNPNLSWDGWNIVYLLQFVKFPLLFFLE